MRATFPQHKWIWHPASRPNRYVLFAHTIRTSQASTSLEVRIAASSYYELFVNGVFAARGPQYGDPAWCLYDEFEHQLDPPARTVHLAVVVHHCSEAGVPSLMKSRGGWSADFQAGTMRFGTDADWRCLELGMWRHDVPKRGWALGYCEDYDATAEPEGWQEKVFDPAATRSWVRPVELTGADDVWSGYRKRMTPMLRRRPVEPVSFRSFVAPGAGAERIEDVSRTSDEEELTPVDAQMAYDPETLSGKLSEANAFTFDLGREHIGFTFVELDAPVGRVLEVSAAELLRNGRPWIVRKGTRHSVRYRTREGRQRFTSFAWDGFRYLHLVVRGGTDGIRIRRVGCMERRVPLPAPPACPTDDATLRRIWDLCAYTLQVAPQEHLIDCPTREQAQYWGDALFIAESLWKGFGERSYLEWYLECFLHVPVGENGQISCVYPGRAQTLLDYSLIPALGQTFYRRNTGRFYRPEDWLDKALKLKAWYEARTGVPSASCPESRHPGGRAPDQEGLVSFDYEEYAGQGLRNFIDHPGLGWHNFPHPGIDREGVSCALNLFYYGFVNVLGEMAAELGRPESQRLGREGERLGQAIRRAFFDGEVFHDARRDDRLSPGTSWQTNALAVFFDLVRDREAAGVMRRMLDGYDRLCRCSPYFHFYFLEALRKAGLVREAEALIKCEWTSMIDGDATTTWEGFLGDEQDSLCHPWSTAPFLFLLGNVAREGRETRAGHSITSRP